MDDEAKPYLLTEASGLTGLSVDALRKRIERKRLRGTRSNEDGQWRVWLTSRDVETAKVGRYVDKSSHSLDDLPDESRTIRALEDELAAVREDLSRERTRAATVGGEAKRLEEERDRLLRERDVVQVEANRERDRAEGALIRAAAAEAEAKALRETLTEARRPFWRRWIG